MSLGFSECPHISVTLTNMIPHRACLEACLQGELDHGKLTMSSNRLNQEGRMKPKFGCLVASF